MPIICLLNLEAIFGIELKLDIVRYKAMSGRMVRIKGQVV